MLYHNIFDSHSHYYDRRFDQDREALLSHELAEGGVSCIMGVGDCLETSRDVIKMAEQYPHCYAAAGIHPEHANNTPSPTDRALWESNVTQPLCTLLRHPKVKALGEIGLDYHYEGYNAQRQRQMFTAQLEIAAAEKLPVIVHCRDATADCLDILKQYRPKGVMHCFSGSAETAEEIQKLGMYISFTGVVTFKNARKTLEAAAAVDLSRLLLETDCPYMAPEPFRGRRCDSRFIAYTAEKLAEIHQISPQELIDQCAENTKKLFRLAEEIKK